MLINYDLMTGTADAFGFRLADLAETRAAVDLCRKLTGLETASAEQASAVQEYTECSLWVFGRPVSGFHYVMPLTGAGHAALLDGSFKTAAPLSEHLCARGEPCEAFYVSIYAGETHEARKAIMTASAMFRVNLFGAVPCYARAATDDGARSMASLGFAPIEGGLPDLWGQAAIQKDQVA